MIGISNLFMYVYNMFQEWFIDPNGSSWVMKFSIRFRKNKINVLMITNADQASLHVLAWLGTKSACSNNSGRSKVRNDSASTLSLISKAGIYITELYRPFKPVRECCKIDFWRTSHCSEMVWMIDHSHNQAHWAHWGSWRRCIGGCPFARARPQRGGACSRVCYLAIISRSWPRRFDFTVPSINCADG